jgi:hypothetical protein
MGIMGGTTTGPDRSETLALALAGMQDDVASGILAGVAAHMEDSNRNTARLSTRLNFNSCHIGCLVVIRVTKYRACLDHTLEIVLVSLAPTSSKTSKLGGLDSTSPPKKTSPPKRCLLGLDVAGI